MAKRLDELNRQMNTIIVEKRAREIKERKKMGFFEWGSLFFGIGIFIMYNIPAFTLGWYDMLFGIMGISDWMSVVPFVAGFLIVCFLPDLRVAMPLLFTGALIFLWISIRAVWFLDGGWITLYIIAMILLFAGIGLYIRYYYLKKTQNRK